jgi:Fic family protein
MLKVIEIWKGISFPESWKKASTSKFDELVPSWYSKRKTLKSDTKEYSDFLIRMKRQHAIETGVIEKLYDLKEGITETFIKEGFVESYLQHGDTNIHETELMDYLNDQFEAVQFVFDIVSSERPLTKGFILELHSLLTRHQEFCEAKDSLGNRFKAKLIKGAFKKLENNPQRDDDVKYVYCPPEQVEPEIEKLIQLYNDAEKSNISPIIIAAWFHHSFTTIHPFQDGNGRMARLLASLVLIKHGLFPLTVRRQDKKAYIDGLINADNGDVSFTVDFFCETQKRSIEAILNLKVEESIAQSTLSEVASLFTKKVNGWKENKLQERQKAIAANRKYIFTECSSYLTTALQTIYKQIPIEIASITLETAFPENDKKYYWYAHQIIDYANKYNYFFNRSLPRGWFCFNVHIKGGINYGVIITIHHYGYDDMTMAIGGILETSEETSDSDSPVKSYSPINLPPYTLSLENNTIEKIKGNLLAHLQQIVALGFAEIINELE